MARMKKIVEDAKKRRKLLLTQFEKSGITIAEFAERHQLTPVRMGQILKKARKDSLSV